MPTAALHTATVVSIPRQVRDSLRASGPKCLRGSQRVLACCRRLLSPLHLGQYCKNGVPRLPHTHTHTHTHTHICGWVGEWVGVPCRGVPFSVHSSVGTCCSRRRFNYADARARYFYMPACFLRPMTNRMVGAALPSPALKVRGLLVIQAPARLATLVGMLVLLDRRVGKCRACRVGGGCMRRLYATVNGLKSVARVC